MGLYSKARIEFSEEVSKGVYNTFAFESGKDGDEDLAGDLADVLKNCPRPMEVLAKTVCETYDRIKSKDPPPPFLKAAMDLVKEWEAYDQKALQVKRIEDLPEPPR